MHQAEILTQLQIIEDVKDRMVALASNKGVPDNVIKQLSKDAISLDWACSELRKLYLVNLTIVAGDTTFVSSCIPNIQVPSSSFVTSGDLSSIVIFEPDQVINGIIRDSLVPGNWNGNTFPQKKNAKFWVCSKYFASGDLNDLSKRAILFECTVLKTWLNDTGYISAKREISEWAFKVFNSMKWDQAKLVD